MMSQRANQDVRRQLAWLCVVVACAVMMWGTASISFAQSKPKLLPTAKPSECASCHGKTIPLPTGHSALTNKKLSDCSGCHPRGDSTSLRGKLPLFHNHLLAGLTCKSCHDNPRKPEPPASTKCLTCHTGDAILAATAQVKPTNPHGSPHYGKENDCNLCHHQHGKSENFCSQCHVFKFTVP
jgi:hypothetical protein